MAVTLTGDVRPYSGTGTRVELVFTVADAPRTLTSPNRVIYSSYKKIPCESDGTFSVSLEPGAYTLLINKETTLTIQVPTSDADLSDPGVIVSAVTPGAIPGALPEIATNARLTEWVAAGSYQITSATYDSDGVISTGVIAWPDGSSGVWTTISKDASLLTVSSYSVTYAATSKTITQPTITFDANGNVTTKPALVIT